MRRAKIVCTLGPASDSNDGIRALVESGMDVARLNFSHGTHDEHGRRAEAVRRASAELGRPVALLMDLGGPKIRTTGRGPASLSAGETIELVSSVTRAVPQKLREVLSIATEEALGGREAADGGGSRSEGGAAALPTWETTAARTLQSSAQPEALAELRPGGTSGSSKLGAHALEVDYPTLADDVEVGDRILLADGKIELRVIARRDDRLVCRVEHGGVLRPRMGVNLPAHRVRSSAITPKDRDDLEYGLSIGVDYVALSFVRSAGDIEELRALSTQLGRPTPIVAKIETPAAVDDLEGIVELSDAVMVARGDLGVELAPERVPVIQRQIVGVCRMKRKPVIVATEMLHSMIESPRPTRAEASDVAGAVFGGADALMLSGETASGQYPTEACSMMDRIIREAEASQFFHPEPSPPGDDTPAAVAEAACELARTTKLALIVALTQSGGTARLVSKARPPVKIVAFSPDETTLRRLALLWGVEPRPLRFQADIEALAPSVRSYLSGAGLVQNGEKYVMIFGAPVGVRGGTNSLRVEEVT